MYWLEWLLYCATIQWPVFGWYVWDKGSGMPGNWSGRLAPSHEFVFHFNQRGQLINKWVATKENMPASRGFRKADGSIKLPYSPDKAQQPYKVPDSIIRINRACSGEIYRSYHPAVFPVALPEFVYKTWSQPGDIVYEPFCGSGTSIIAGENLNRKVYACEISEEYCELAIKRWQTLTCRKAVQS
jgi:DNA modification methylase